MTEEIEHHALPKETLIKLILKEREHLALPMMRDPVI